MDGVNSALDVADPSTVVLFDLDGTLTDSYLGITRSYIHAFTEIGLEPPSADALRSVVGPPLHVSMAGFGLSRAQTTAAIAAYRERYHDVGWLENRLFDGMADLVADLSASGRSMAVATSKNQPIARRIVEHFGLADHFTAVAGAGDDGTRGTKAEVIAHALDVLESDRNTSRTVMIGDRSHDVEGAAAHGIRTIGVRWGYALPGELEAAMGTTGEWIVDSVQQLREEFGV